MGDYWNIDPMRGFGPGKDDDQSDSWVEWTRSWFDFGGWLGRYHWYDDGCFVGCLCLTVAAVITAAVIFGVFIGQMWR